MPRKMTKKPKKVRLQKVSVAVPSIESSRQNPRIKVEKLNYLPNKFLLKICTYLEWNDLANLAAACSRFIIICSNLFESRIEGEQFRVSALSDRDKFKSYVYAFTIFGDKIKILRVDYDSCRNRENKFIHDLIMNKCHSTLVAVHFTQMLANFQINRIFPELRLATFTMCHLSASATKFKAWCPNLHQLNLEMIQSVTSTSCIERKFPSLVQLSLLNYNESNFGNKNLMYFMKNNRQLNELRLSHNIFEDASTLNNSTNRIQITVELLSYMAEALPLLESLDLVYMQRAGPKTSTAPPPKFSNLKHLKLSCQDAKTLHNLVFPAYCNKTIETFSIDCRFGVNDDIVEYIWSCERLESLTWNINNLNDLKYVHKLSKIPMPALTKLKFNIFYGEEHDHIKRSQIFIYIIDFMAHNDRLKTIEVGSQITNGLEKEINQIYKETTLDVSKNDDGIEIYSPGKPSNDEEYPKFSPASNPERPESSQIKKKLDLKLLKLQMLASLYKYIGFKFNNAWSISEYEEEFASYFFPFNDEKFRFQVFTKRE